MDQDTDIGGAQHRFPVTRHSAILAAPVTTRRCVKRAFATIVESYWNLLTNTFASKWHAANEDAKDLTQSFFAAAIDKDYFRSYDPAKASFQTLFALVWTGSSPIRESLNSASSVAAARTISRSISARRKTNSLCKSFRRQRRKNIFIESGYVVCCLAVEALRRHCAEKGSNVTSHCSSFTILREDDSETKCHTRRWRSSLA